jgi:putative endonuclease
MLPWGHCALGKTGENLACEEITRRGYAILARRYRTRAGEIDIVARDGDAIVFIEVKTRRTGRRGTAADAMTVAKRRQVGQMALDWLARHRLMSARCRFDVVAIAFGDGGRSTVTVIPNAFAIGE